MKYLWHFPLTPGIFGETDGGVKILVQQIRRNVYHFTVEVPEGVANPLNGHDQLYVASQALGECLDRLEREPKKKRSGRRSGK